jgi:hypothetical protein
MSHTGTDKKERNRGLEASPLRGRNNPPGFDLPPGTHPFTADEILFVKWMIDRTCDPPYVSLDPATPRIYSSDYLAKNNRPEYLTDIFSFAQDVANGNLTLPGEGKHPPPLPPNNQMGPDDFVIWYPCYVVFALEGADWQFLQQSKAVRTSLQQSQPYKYVDLCHVIPGNQQPTSGVGSSSGCLVAYFSANAAPGVFSSDDINLFFQWIPVGQIDMKPYTFDPAVKNDGHTTIPTASGDR